MHVTALSTRRLILTVAVCVGGLGACKGCDGEPSVAEREAQSEQAVRQSRLAARKIDRNKSYPKATDGSITCDHDLDCFLVQAERCTPATLTHREIHSYLGMTQLAESEYRIVGRSGDKCRLTRQTLKLGVELEEQAAQVLLRAGKTQEDLADMRANTLFRLKERHPAKVDCTLPNESLVDGMLDIAEGQYVQLWRTACRQVPGASAPVISDGTPTVVADAHVPLVEAAPSGASQPEGARPAVTQAKEDPEPGAKPDVPAPKQSQ